MRFGFVHRLMTDALAALGLLSLITSGELDHFIAIGISVCLLGVFFVPESYQAHPRLKAIGMYGSVALLISQLVRWTMGGDALTLAVEFAAALQVIRLATRRGAAHDQQIILLALLHLVAGTVLGGGLAYGLCFLGFLVVAPGALVLSHLRREVEGNYRQGARDRTGLPVDVPRILRSRRVISKGFLAFTCSLAIPVLLFTAVLFIAFPRVGLSLLLINHNRASRMIGFRDKVDLGGVGKLRSDPAVAMRIHPAEKLSDPPQRLSLYLRGTAFDFYDGRSWTRTIKGRKVAYQTGNVVWLGARDRSLGSLLFTVDLEPISPPVVFLPGDASAVKLLNRGEAVFSSGATLFAGGEGEYKYTSPDDHGLRYEVYVDQRRSLLRESVGPADLARYLALPPNTSPAIFDLAESWVGDTEQPLVLADRIEQRLRQDFTYDLDSPSGAAERPLEHFLFESKRGHCEFYSTAMVIMLRGLGVPARNVTGFVGGTYNRFGEFYVVRQGDAHSWVEVHADGLGWRRFDPTPPASAAPQAEVAGALAFLRDVMEAAAHRWSRHVVGYNLSQQVSLFRDVRNRTRPQPSEFGSSSSPRTLLLGVGGALLLVAFGIWAWRRWGRHDRDDPEALETRAEARRVVELYRDMERRLAQQGLLRATSDPPLAFAVSLEAMKHPLAAEVMDITQAYLRVRFGRGQLTELDYKRLSQRIDELNRPRAA